MNVSPQTQGIQETSHSCLSLNQPNSNCEPPNPHWGGGTSSPHFQVRSRGQEGFSGAGENRQGLTCSSSPQASSAPRPTKASISPVLPHWDMSSLPRLGGARTGPLPYPRPMHRSPSGLLLLGLTGPFQVDFRRVLILCFSAVPFL